MNIWCQKLYVFICKHDRIIKRVAIHIQLYCELRFAFSVEVTHSDVSPVNSSLKLHGFFFLFSSNLGEMNVSNHNTKYELPRTEQVFSVILIHHYSRTCTWAYNNKGQENKMARVVWPLNCF